MSVRHRRYSHHPIVNPGPEVKPTLLWTAVDELLAGATLRGILAHKLGPLEANRLRRRAESLPAPLILEERAATLCALVARPLVERIRAGSESPLLLIKGPEIASSYPGRARTFGDVDILTPDAPTLQKELLAAGFVEDYDPEVIAVGVKHHLMPLKWPTIELILEVHRSPNWPNSLPPPPMDEVFGESVPSALGVAGVSAPRSDHHALLIASHAWRNEPLWRLRDLIDVAAIAALADEREIYATAARWGMRRLWHTTHRAIDAIFYGGKNSMPLRTWARHLEEVRDRTGLDGHLTQLMSGYWALPPMRALGQTTRAIRNIVGPNPNESWREKALRFPGSVRKLDAPLERPDLEQPPTEGTQPEWQQKL